jgi:MFS family permease
MTTVTTEQSHPPLWAPLRTASYRYLLTGQSASLLGDQLLIVALPFLVLGTGAGARGLGAVFAAYGAARVVALPIGGWLGDRYSRRAVMIGSDGVRGVLVLALVLLAGRGFTGITAIAAVMAAVGFAEGVFLPASYAILPSTVPAEHLGRANGLSSGTQNLALLVGPGLGGLLAAAVSPRLCLGIDAATFAVSIATLLLVRPLPVEEAPEAARPATLRFLATSSLMRVAISLTLVSNLAYYGMLEVALPVFSADVLHTAAYGYGTALAAFGLGSLLGGLAIPILERHPRRGLLACGIGAIQGGAFAAVAQAASLPPTAVLMALAGITCGLLNVFYLSRIQEHVPDHLLGRAMSLLMLAVFAIHPVSVAAAGQLTQTSGAAIVFVAAGLSITVAFVIGSLTRTYRNL